MEPLTLSRRAACAGALGLAAAPALARPVRRIRTGLDRLVADGAGILSGRRIGLLTHDGAVAADGRRSAEVMAALPGVTLAALFAPEHGLAGSAAASEHVGDGRDPRSGVPVYSLYGARAAPTAGQLAGLDRLVIDLQDVGLRCYTYAGTALAAIAAARSAGVGVVVLDRPNPLGGAVEGPFLDIRTPRTPVSRLALPYRHGLTLGEIARLLAPPVEVLAMRGWRRDLGVSAFAAGGLPFVAPSPNLRSPAAVLAYAASVLIEGTNLSEGRGTSRPFEQLGAPWLDGARLAEALGAARLPGVRFAPTTFTPTASKCAGEPCRGIALAVTDAARFRGFDTGLAIVAAVRRLHPDRFRFLPGTPPYFDLLTGVGWVRTGIEAGTAEAAIAARARSTLKGYAKWTAPARLYESLPNLAS